MVTETKRTLANGFSAKSLAQRGNCLSRFSIGLCLLFLPSIEAFAEPAPLSADEIRDRLIGNTLVFQHGGQVLGRRYLAEDGTAAFDPVRGFRIPGHWVLDEKGERLCFWDIDPESTYCARFLMGEGQYFIDWGDSDDLDLGTVVEPGDTTESSDDPGPDYKPHPDIPLPADLNIQPPASGVPRETAALSGAWFGTFSVWRDYVIIVEKIEGSHADVVFAWGPDHFQPDDPGWTRHRADIGNGTLDIKLRWGTISGQLGEDGTLTAISDWGEGPKWSRAIRWDDPSLAPQPPLQVLAPIPDSARDKLAFWDIQMSRNLNEDPLHNDYYMPLGEAGPVHHTFEGTLTVGDSEVLGRPAGSRGASDHGVFPPFSVDFISQGDRLVPRERGILPTGRDGARWDIIVEPGRIWSEPGDNGWSRASFPFLLDRIHKVGHGRNGLATFLFNDREISPLRFQVVKEASSSPSSRPLGAGRASATSRS